jgi:predicted PurR-regulated permease PerM
MAIASLLPVVGPGLVWVPAAILLLTTERILAGVVLIFVGVVLVGLADNLLRPVLVGRDTRMPDYLVLLATLGGLALFGITGLVIGPLIAALFITLWEMFEESYGDREAERAAARADDGPAGDSADGD